VAGTENPEINYFFACAECPSTGKSWASAHRGNWGQVTPGKMGEKLKSENMQKRAVFYVYLIF